MTLPGSEKDLYQVSLKLLLTNSKGEILALKAVDQGSFAGYYDLPGGRIGEGEFKLSLAEIIKREAAEEIGDVKFQLWQKPVALGRHLIAASAAGSAKDIHVLYLFFEAELLGGEVKTSEEYTGYQWLDLDKIKLSDYFTSGILEGIQTYYQWTVTLWQPVRRKSGRSTSKQS